MEERVDFISQMLAQSEAAEERKKVEMDRLRADAMLGAVSVVEQQMGDVNKLAEDEIRLIEEYRSRELARLDKKVSWLVWNLEQFMRSTKEKTLRLPRGELKIRKGRDRIAVVAMEKFLEVAGKLRLLRSVPETHQPDNQAILNHIKRTGEVPAGIEYIPAENKFSYTVNGGDNGRE